MAEESGIGAVSFVSCATGSDPPKNTTEDDDDDQSQSKFSKFMYRVLKNWTPLRPLSNLSLSNRLSSLFKDF